MKLRDGGATAAGVALLYTIFLALVGSETDQNSKKKDAEIASLEAKVEEQVKIEELGHGPNVRVEGNTDAYYIPEGTPNLPALLTQFKAGDIIHIVPKKEPPLSKQTPDKITIEQAAPSPSSSPATVHTRKVELKPVDKKPNDSETIKLIDTMKKSLDKARKEMYKEPKGADGK